MTSKFFQTKPPHTKICAGVDEVGRGSWAGPVVSAALIFTDSIDNKLIRDSKKLTVLSRQKAFLELKKKLFSD